MVETLKKLIDAPFEISPIDKMHLSIKKSDLSSDSSIKDIVKSLNSKFPWAMVYDETKEKFHITLA